MQKSTAISVRDWGSVNVSLYCRDYDYCALFPISRDIYSFMRPAGTDKLFDQAACRRFLLFQILWLANPNQSISYYQSITICLWSYCSRAGFPKINLYDIWLDWTACSQFRRFLRVWVASSDSEFMFFLEIRFRELCVLLQSLLSWKPLIRGKGSFWALTLNVGYVSPVCIQDSSTI